MESRRQLGCHCPHQGQWFSRKPLVQPLQHCDPLCTLPRFLLLDPRRHLAHLSVSLRQTRSPLETLQRTLHGTFPPYPRPRPPHNSLALAPVRFRRSKLRHLSPGADFSLVVAYLLQQLKMLFQAGIRCVHVTLPHGQGTQIAHGYTLRTHALVEDQCNKGAFRSAKRGRGYLRILVLP